MRCYKVLLSTSTEREWADESRRKRRQPKERYKYQTFCLRNTSLCPFEMIHKIMSKIEPRFSLTGIFLWRWRPMIIFVLLGNIIGTMDWMWISAFRPDPIQTHSICQSFSNTVGCIELSMTVLFHNQPVKVCLKQSNDCRLQHLGGIYPHPPFPVFIYFSLCSVCITHRPFCESNKAPGRYSLAWEECMWRKRATEGGCVFGELSCWNMKGRQVMRVSHSVFQCVHTVNRLLKIELETFILWLVPIKGRRTACFSSTVPVCFCLVQNRNIRSTEWYCLFACFHLIAHLFLLSQT